MRSYTIKNLTHETMTKGVIFLIFFFSVLPVLMSQTVEVFDLPTNCKAKDLEPVSATLTDLPACIDCDEQSSWPATLTVKINNTTGSTRTSFAFWAVLETTTAEGTAEVYIYGCKGPVEPGLNNLDFGENDDNLKFYDQNGVIIPGKELIYECGSTLKLTDIVMGWTPASEGGNECPLSGSDIESKCDYLDVIQINTPVTGIVDDVVYVSCFEGADGSIFITPSGGIPPYSYEWSMEEDPAFSSDSQDLQNIGAGTYSVTITDSTTPDNCSFTIEDIVVLESDELIAVLDNSDDPSCFDGSNGAIDITVTGGTPSYTYLWSNGATTQDVSGLEAGTYSVTVTDANGCTDTLSGIEIDEPSELVAILDDSDDVSCFDDSDGSIEISVSGGTGAYTYLWSNGATTQDISGLEAGTYSVTVTDANGCTDTLSGIEIDEPTELVVTVLLITDASCAGSQTGAIDIGVTGGTASYTYLWSNGATTQDLSSIGAGNYSVTVTDGNGCEEVLSGIMVDDPSSLEVVATLVTDTSCFDGNNGAIDITVTGGTPSYTYLWSNGATTQDVSGLEAGTYSVTVTDANGCTDTLSGIEIDEPSELIAILDNPDNVSCFDGSDGAIDITVTGGTPSYTYLWSNGATTQDVSGLEAGTYSVTVTDANGCTDTLSGIEIDEPSELVAILDDSDDVSCFDGSDGSIEISVSGGTGAYTYLWSNGATTQDISGLEAGTYSVTVTDANGCTDTLSGIEIDEPTELVVTVLLITDASCAGSQTGAIDIGVTGGTASYTYLWSNGATTQDLSSIGAGNYSVTVTDGNGCEEVLSGIMVDDPSSLEVVATLVTDTSCFDGNNGAIDITVTGGTPSYTYLWSNGATTQDVSGLEAGTYSVTVTDANGCTDTLSGIEIDEPSGLIAILDNPDNVSCFDGSDGSIEISVSGGTGAYTYLWSNGATTQDVSGLEAGTYSVTVTDANGCTDTLSGIEIDEPSELVAILDDSDDVSCFDGSDGSIEISVSGGTGAYTYLWSNGATTQDISGLEAGTYSVTVTDANGCTDTLSGIEIDEPTELVVTVLLITDASCAGSQTGAIDIGVTGGTASYTYLWSNGATTQDLSSIGAGNYSVTVTDGNGCEEVLSGIMVDDPSSLEVVATLVTDTSCFDGNNGAIDITVTGGTPSYTYLWSNGATTQDVSGLEAGTYSVTVTDANGCTDTLSGIEIDEPVQVATPVVQVAPADCFAASGSFSILNSPAGFEYSLDGGDWFSYTGTLTGVDPGPHSLVVRDANECESAPLNFDVPQPFETPVAPTISAIQPDCDTLTGTIIVTSGTTGFMFSINGGDFVSYPQGGFTGLAPDTYEVRARSNDLCISDISTIILEEPICEEFDGCTLGYWKNHTNRWCGDYQTCTSYVEAFFNYEGGYNDAPKELRDLTLQEVLNLGGGGVYNFGRQSVAALLNACSEEVDYELPETTDVIDYVRNNVGTPGAAGSYLDMLNNAGCTMGGSRATTAPSDDCESFEKPKGKGTGKNKNAKATSDVSTFPVPFKETVNVTYDFDYTSDVTIQVFDMRGQHLRTYKDKKVTKGSVTRMNVDFALKANQMYILKVTTDRETFVKQIVSSKK